MKRYNKTMPELFNEIDQNNDGYLSKPELKDIFKHRIVICNAILVCPP
jgi:Ca2+-binding EF-hand superfamily protein